METIAFIGCGAMGAPIAERLIDAGDTVRLFDPRAEAIAPLAARGGVAAASPREAATGAEVAFACLPSSEVSRAVAFGAGGAASLRTYVEMSTMYKDVHLCLEEAKHLKVPMWLGANVVEMWHMGMAKGRGDDDFTSLIQMIEKWAGVVVGGNQSGPVK